MDKAFFFTSFFSVLLIILICRLQKFPNFKKNWRSRHLVTNLTLTFSSIFFIMMFPFSIYRTIKLSPWNLATFSNISTLLCVIAMIKVWQMKRTGVMLLLIIIFSILIYEITLHQLHFLDIYDIVNYTRKYTQRYLDLYGAICIFPSILTVGSVFLKKKGLSSWNQMGSQDGLFMKSWKKREMVDNFFLFFSLTLCIATTYAISLASTTYAYSCFPDIIYSKVHLFYIVLTWSICQILINKRVGTWVMLTTIMISPIILFFYPYDYSGYFPFQFMPLFISVTTVIIIMVIVALLKGKNNKNTLSLLSNKTDFWKSQLTYPFLLYFLYVFLNPIICSRLI